MLGYDEFGFVGPVDGGAVDGFVFYAVVFGAVDEADEVGVLLYGAGLTQVGELRTHASAAFELISQFSCDRDIIGVFSTWLRL